jgi:adenylate kinase family enzyme
MAFFKGIFYHLVFIFRGVRVFALVGGSGTGKSFRAKLVAERHGIELLVDDGLLIHEQKILAGRSAKREKGILAAIGTALFADEKHAEGVRQVLSRTPFKRILLIGTSEKMVRKIAKRLQLPHPTKIIRIEDVASREEIAAAIRSRRTEGKHIIPVPALEVKRSYPHIFLDSMKIFFKRRFQPMKSGNIIEKTVVRPEYSTRGRVSISEAAVTQMVLHCVQEFDAAIRVEKVVVSREFNDYRLEVIVELPLRGQAAAPLYELQEYIAKNIENFTGIILREVNVTIGRVSKGPGQAGIQ